VTAVLAALLAALAMAQAAGAEGLRVKLAQGKGAVRAAVPGPVSLRLRAGNATVEVLPSASPEVRVEVPDRAALLIALFQVGGDRIEVEFDGRHRLQQGALKLWVPRESKLDLGSLDGAIAVRGVGGDVRVRGMSGDVDLVGAAHVDVESIDGEVDVLDATASVTVRTISGNVTVSTAGSAPRVDVETESGNLDWRGACAKGCHLDADTVSGQLRFAIDRAASSFELRYMSHSGKLRDTLAMRAEAPQRKSGERASSAFAFGKGEGEIECESFSGDLAVQPR
jgi:hypothetical protein